MGPGQRPPADAGVEVRADGDNASTSAERLHVAQLADVEVAGASRPRVQPRKMSLAACIIRCPLDDALAGLPAAALRQVVFQHRRRGLLDLQEQRVLLVPPLQQPDQRPGSDTADADDLAGASTSSNRSSR